MRERPDHRSADLLQQLPEALLAGHLRAQDHHV